MPLMWFSVVKNNLQFCVFCSFILSLISLLSCWRCLVMSCVRGRVELNFNVPLLDEVVYLWGKVRVVVFPVA